MAKVNLEKIIKWGIYLSAFMPLIIFSEFMSPFHFGKVIVFRSLVEILAVLYLVLLVKYGKSYLPPRTPLFWAVTIFTLVFGLTAFTSINVYQSFFGTLERMGGWFSFLHFWMFFAIAAAVLRKKEDWIFFIQLSLAASLLSAFYGFLQKTDWNWVIGSGGRNKIFGTIGNPALFAGYMIVNAFLALMFYFKPDNSQKAGTVPTLNKKYFYGAVFLLDALAVLMAGIRGSVLAVVIGLIVFGLLYSLGFGSKKVKKLTLGFCILVIAAAGILYSLRNADFVKNSHYLSRYADISPAGRTVQTRALAWRAGFDGWSDSLRTIVLGWGPEMFNVPFSKHFNPEFFTLGSETLFDRAHNQFLEVLFTMGLIGFAAYLLIFYRAFGVLNKLNDTAENKVFKVGLISVLIAYSIHNFFIFDTSANYLMFFLALGLINVLGQSDTNTRMRSNDANIKSKKPLAANTFGLALTVLAGFLIYQFEIIPAKANYTTTRGIVASWAGQHDLAFEKFKSAMNYDTFGKYEIRHRVGQYVLERANSQSSIDEKTAQQIFTAIDKIKKNVEESPQDYLPYLYISRLYIMLGKADPASVYNNFALENSTKALEISPTYVRTYYEIAQAHLNKKDYQKAAEWFEKVVNLNPKVQLSHWYLGITVAQGGDLKKGAEIIEKSGYDYRSTKTDALRMLDIYVQLNDFQKIAEIFEALVRLDPKDPQNWASLAAAYKQTGEKEKAVQAALKAAELDPSYAAEARNFINSLK